MELLSPKDSLLNNLHSSQFYNIINLPNSNNQNHIHRSQAFTCYGNFVNPQLTGFAGPPENHKVAYQYKFRVVPYTMSRVIEGSCYSTREKGLQATSFYSLIIRLRKADQF